MRAQSFIFGCKQKVSAELIGETFVQGQTRRKAATQSHGLKRELTNSCYAGRATRGPRCSSLESPSQLMRTDRGKAAGLASAGALQSLHWLYSPSRPARPAMRSLGLGRRTVRIQWGVTRLPGRVP